MVVGQMRRWWCCLARGQWECHSLQLLPSVSRGLELEEIVYSRGGRGKPAEGEDAQQLGDILVAKEVALEMTIGDEHVSVCIYVIY